MKRRYICFVLALLALHLFVQCRKEAAPLTAPMAKLSFYNASYLLTLMISDTGGSHQAPLLLDNPDSNYTPPPAGAATQSLPAFNGRNALSTALQYPNIGTNGAQLQPWALYMNTAPGPHSLLLLDTGKAQRHVLSGASLVTPLSTSQTVYFADSLGVFRTVVSADEQLLVAGRIRFRLVQLSPDAGLVSLFVNRQQHYFDGAGYGSVSPYMDYPLDSAARLSIQARSSADTTQVLARAILNAQPGRSYTILLKGYKSSGLSFMGPGGKRIPVSANIGMIVNTSF